MNKTRRRNKKRQKIIRNSALLPCRLLDMSVQLFKEFSADLDFSQMKMLAVAIREQLAIQKAQLTMQKDYQRKSMSGEWRFRGSWK